jgi:hypothetical protein
MQALVGAAGLSRLTNASALPNASALIRPTDFHPLAERRNSVAVGIELGDFLDLTQMGVWRAKTRSADATLELQCSLISLPSVVTPLNQECWPIDHL